MNNGDPWIDAMWAELTRFRNDTGLHPFGWTMDGRPVMMAVQLEDAQRWNDGAPVDPACALLIIEYTDAFEGLKALRAMLGVDKPAGEA